MNAKTRDDGRETLCSPSNASTSFLLNLLPKLGCLKSRWVCHSPYPKLSMSDFGGKVRLGEFRKEILRSTLGSGFAILSMFCASCGKGRGPNV